MPYDFVNRTGDTKKMSASKGTGVNAHEITNILPSEVIRYFMLRFSPSKRLYFDETDTLIKLVDDYSELLAKKHQSELDEEIIYLSSRGIAKKTVSSVPFSHLVATYQTSLGNIDETLRIINRTEHAATAQDDADVIRREIKFVARWLKAWAPEDCKFELLKTVDSNIFSGLELAYLRALADDIKNAPPDADGQWFHDLIYAHKAQSGLLPKDLFTTLYKALIGKSSGPRIGWFLSTLPRDWLIERLSMQDKNLATDCISE